MSASIKLVNIGGDAHDTTYRYKRQIIQTILESKNGGQTRMMNLDKICEDLSTPKDKLSKFIQKELAVSSIKNDTIRANIEATKIETAINKYIISFVLCNKCKLPELDKPDKKGRAACKSCSNIQTI